MSKDTKTKYVGVYRVGDRFRVLLSRGCKQHYLGTYALERDAALAYDRGLLRTTAWRGPRADRFNHEFEARQTLNIEVTEHEVEMLNWLRVVSPGAEREAELAEKLSSNLPDDLIESLQDQTDRTERALKANAVVMNQAKEILRIQAEEITVLKEKVAFLTKAEAELRQELTDLQATGKQAGAPFTMKRIISSGPAEPADSFLGAVPPVPVTSEPTVTQ